MLHPCRTAELVAALQVIPQRDDTIDANSSQGKQMTAAGDEIVLQADKEIAKSSPVSSEDRHKGPNSSSVGYLLTWVSAVGPMVGLHVAAEYALR